ncbi:MAG: pentapeptide repeat-containing protein [Kastovskya adunca ATA6-11-RM4]|nr:pentapeptide repeat-containing protein [Kastovskya adunca ATA6-11-RM4]
MSLSLRHWLAERQIELTQLKPPSALAAGVAFRITQDMEVKSLNCFAISSLADVLELPLDSAWQVVEPIVELTVALIRILNRKKPLRRNEGTWLALQAAYLRALQVILEQESQLSRPWLNRAHVPFGSQTDQPLSDPQLQALLKTLRPGRLSDSQAEQALSAVAESFFVQQMNNACVAWFVANGAEETEARLLTQRLSHGLPGHLLAVIAENAMPLVQLQKFVRLGNVTDVREDSSPPKNQLEDTESFPATLSLNLSREHYRASLLISLSEPLFAEPFALKDIHVPLKGNPLTFGNQNGGLGGGMSLGRGNDIASSPVLQPPIDLMDWAIAQLADKSTIAIIEGEPGSGKTSFCQLWASHAATEFYPNWMPILIQLRHATLGQTLEQTLDSAFSLGSFTHADGWLSSTHPPALLIIDGLDELSDSPQTERQLWTFMDQLTRFHEADKDVDDLPRHKIFLTSRSSTLDSLMSKYRQGIPLPLSALGTRHAFPLKRLAIAPMHQQEFRQWFQQWAKLQSKSIAQTYFSFLKDAGVFHRRPEVKELATLVSQPLMLYLLGILHRDALLDDSVFRLELPQMKFEIYDRICHWLLGEPVAANSLLPELAREGLAHACRSTEAVANLLQGHHSQQVRSQMQAAALTIIQTGQHQAPLNPPTSPDRLPAFFFRTSSPTQSPPLSLEFSHPNLGEYLGAEALAAQLKTLTQQVQDRYGEVSFILESPLSVAQNLYQVLGYGLLSPQMKALVVERLRREERRNADEFSFRVLFGRLYRFYRAYCRGRWVDEGVAHDAYAQLQSRSNSLNVLQIDAAVGLNVFLLLCAGARAAQVPFWPCGDPKIPHKFEADQLLTFIGRTSALSPTAFWQRARASLSGVQLAEACLNRAMLAEANLSQADFSAAELIGTNLVAANLQKADFSWANLTGANLSGANLTGAKLEGADLSGANLTGANLTAVNLRNACLFQAQLDEDSNLMATRNGAIFSLDAYQAYSESLTSQKETEILEEDEVEEDTVYLIESAEGEPDFPEDNWESDQYEGDTAVLETYAKPDTDLQPGSDGKDDGDETW